LYARAKWRTSFEEKNSPHRAPGVGAAMVYLRKVRIRSEEELRQMTTEDQRNTLIVELNLQANRPIRELQGFGDI
jgi:hypothetical protein